MMLKLASVASWMDGLGFGLPCIYGIWHFASGKGMAYFMGFPTYGSGPFEKWGLHTGVTLMSTFLVVCIMQCITGWLIWDGYKTGAILSLTILPFEMFFYYGFALPFGPPFALFRVIATLFLWKSFH